MWKFYPEIIYFNPNIEVKNKGSNFSLRKGNIIIKRKYWLNSPFFIELKSEVIDCSNQSIYPQWLPVKAWYFGGTMKLDVFNSEMYIKLIEKYRPIFRV